MPRAKTDCPDCTPVPPSPLVDLHKRRLKALAKERAAAAKAAQLAGERKALEEEILSVLADRRASGEEPTAVVGGTRYTSAHRTPWDGVDHAKVREALLAEGHPEFLGKPLYGEIKAHYGDLARVPRALQKVLVVREIGYLSATKAGGR